MATAERNLRVVESPGAQATPAIRRPSLRRSAERILELAHLPHDWDSEGADPPSGVAVAATAVLMTAVQEQHGLDIPERVAPSFSAPIPDGGLQVEWEGSGARIDVQVNPDGSYGYLAMWGVGPAAEY